MNYSETKKVPYFREWKTLRQGEFTAGKNVGNIVIAQPGLGATIGNSFFIKSLREKVIAGAHFSLFAVDHPCYGLNEEPYLDNFTLPACMANTKKAIKYILESGGTQKVVLAGNSLGFWSPFQSSCDKNNDPRILGLLGKSGISSYESIIGRILIQFWYEEGPDIAWRKLFRHLNIDWTTGNCHIEINDWGIVSIHENFFHSVGFVRENRVTSLPIECWHGENDTYTSTAEMQSHNWGNITVHVVPGVWHNLSAWLGDDTPHRVHREMNERIEEIFAESI